MSTSDGEPGGRASNPSRTHDPLIPEVAAIDRMVHEPARFCILNVLSGGGLADFTLLLNVTGVARGSLSEHLRRLEDAGLIEIRKSFVSRRPRTRASITPKGEQALGEHWQQLNRMIEKSIHSGEDRRRREEGNA